MKRVIRLSETDLIRIVRDIIHESNINELSPDTFLSAAEVSTMDRGTPKRTKQIGRLFFNKFLGMELLNGTVDDIDVEYGDTPDDVFIKVKIKYPYSGYDPTKTITYDVSEDEFYGVEQEIDRRDSVRLSKIAAHINPDTRYKETGKHFRIKGWY